MAQYRISKSFLQGGIAIPSSKSHTLRAILFGALAKGTSIVRNPLRSPDTEAMVSACRHLGAKIGVCDNVIEIVGIDGKIQQAEDVINAGNSGLVLRMIAAVSALAPRPIVITGDYSIRHQRPMRSLIDGLRQLGVSATSTRGDGYAPVIIQGPMQSGHTVVDGEDSQPVSSLLIASIFAPGPIVIYVRNPGEKPWVALTLDWFKRLGISCENENFEKYSVHGNGRYEGFEYCVPGDWSSAAFPIAAALVTGSEISLSNVDLNDCQGDKAVLDVFCQMGARIEVEPEKRKLHVFKSKLHGVDIDINHFVDAINVLAAVGCYAEGETRIRNASVARQKECDRIRCMAEELGKMGAAVIEHDDGLTIRKSSLRGSKVFSHRDHRMVMSLAIAALGAEGTTHIEDTECVAKTFPSFSEDFRRLGAYLEVV